MVALRPPLRLMPVSRSLGQKPNEYVRKLLRAELTLLRQPNRGYTQLTAFASKAGNWLTLSGIKSRNLNRFSGVFKIQIP
ncbi:hypothetical protein D3C86_1093190 [compost metagenome]